MFWTGFQFSKPDKMLGSLEFATFWNQYETNEVFTYFVSFYLFPQWVFIKKEKKIRALFRIFLTLYQFFLQIVEIFCFIVTSLSHSSFIANFFFFKTFSYQSLIPEIWNHLKCGFLTKSFTMNAPFRVEHLLITFWWVQHIKATTKWWLSCLTLKGAFIRNDLLRNPHSIILRFAYYNSIS